MRLSLRMKLLAAFAAVGLAVLLVSSLGFYFSFQRMVFEGFEGELIEDAREFAETVVYEGGAVRVLDHYEWEDVEEEFVAATDSRFRTLRKSENLGDAELQTFADFRPVSEPETVRFGMGDVSLLCVVFPVKREGSVVAYILLAGRTEQVAGYVEILKESILIASIVLVCFGVGLAYVLAGRMVQPVLSLQRAVDRMDLAHLDRRVELVRADTELRSLVETLNSLFGRLEKSYREINDFSANVAHELHTPLTILRGNIEVALTRERENGEYVEILSGLLDETLHVIHIVDSLLLLARGDTGSFSIGATPVDLGAFCEEHASDWEAVCSLKNQPLEVRVEAPYTVSGDPSLLAQLLLNLVSNASRFSGEGQPVGVDVRRAGEGRVEIAVRDRGVGIPEADRKKVFERFHRAQGGRVPEAGGAGLGLSICKMISRLHGGTIDLDSEVGQGTAVMVTLPARG